MKEVGVGTRVINFVADIMIIASISYALFKWWSFYVYYWQYKFYPYYVFFYGTIFFYYTFFEAIFSRSPGKWLTISKVRDLKGTRPVFFQVILRSLLRLILIDMFFIPFLDRPLHDHLSRTRVVEA